MISISSLTTLYLFLSWLLLDGKLSYWTSANPSTIEDSKKENVFVTDKLIVQSEGDSLKNWQTRFDIWTNKRYETKYYGFIFHWTFEDPEWRYLNIESKKPYSESNGNNSWFRHQVVRNSEVLEEHSQGNGWHSCCNRIGCYMNDTIKIVFNKGMNDSNIIGQLRVIIK